MTWLGNTIYLDCCEHGVYHMLESEGGGGSAYFTASRTSSRLVNQYNTHDATTVYHHKTYRNTYYAYVNAGKHQDVDGYWSEDYETATTSPRLGGVDPVKKSANPGITDGNGSYSTAGTVYGIFSDAACTYQLNSMTTGSDGKASLWGFYAGSTVYVKEAKPSPGYDLDKNVYKASITADQWSHVNGDMVHEPPKTATVCFFADGDPNPVHSVVRPLGTSLATGDPEVREAMSKSSSLLRVSRDVLPPSRQVDWGGRKIALKDPWLEILCVAKQRRAATNQRHEQATVRPTTKSNHYISVVMLHTSKHTLAL